MFIEQVIGLVLLVVATMWSGLHQIPEGYVGVYFRGGALLKGTTEPGWHTKLPFMTSFDTIQVSV